MPENPSAARLRNRIDGLHALQRTVDECADAETALTAVFLDGGPPAGDGWSPTAGNGSEPAPRLAASLAREVRDTDLIMQLGSETLLCALPGMAVADGRRRFERVAERLGGGAIRVGVAGPAPGGSALDLATSAEVDASALAEGGSPARLSLRLPADMRAARRARVAMRIFEDGLDADDLAVLALIVTELVTNSVRHGSAGPADAVLVEITMDGDALHGAVVDQGPGFEPGIPESDGGPGGLGLMIVHRASKRWGTADEGRTVWFELDRSPAPERLRLD